MEISKDNCAALLVISSIAVLALNYSLVSVGGFSFSFGALSLSDVKFSKYLPAIISFSLILSSLMFHVYFSIQELAPIFSDGYQESPQFIELVQSLVTQACGHSNYGSPRGGLSHAFWRRKHEIGKFIIKNNRLSDPVTIYPSLRVHNLSVLYGVRHCLSFRQWLKHFIPVIIALWALLVIAV